MVDSTWGLQALLLVTKAKAIGNYVSINAHCGATYIETVVLGVSVLTSKNKNFETRPSVQATSGSGWFPSVWSFKETEPLSRTNSSNRRLLTHTRERERECLPLSHPCHALATPLSRSKLLLLLLPHARERDRGEGRRPATPRIHQFYGI